MADTVAIVGIVVVAGLLYAATLSDRVHPGDGAMLGDWTANLDAAYPHYHNTLYVPAARALATVVPFNWLRDDPLAIGKWLSVGSAAVGLAFTYVISRRLGAPLRASLLGVALLALSPMLWYFATTIEVHSQHFAVVTACATVTALAPWRRPLLASAIAAIAIVPPYLSHQSAPVLLPGWLLLVQCARRRCAVSFGLRTLAAIGAALCVALLIGHMATQWLRGNGFAIDLMGTSTTVAGWRREFSLAIVWTDIVAPLAMLGLAALLAIATSIDRWLVACAVAMTLPLMGCVVWWGIPERGGYLLGPSFMLAAIVAHRWRSWWSKSGRWTAALLVAAQVATCIVMVQSDLQGPFQLRDRVAAVRRACEAGGTLISANINAPAVSLWLPDIREVNVVPWFAGEATIEQVVAGGQGPLRAFVHGSRCLLDRSYTRCPDLLPKLHEGMARIEALIRAEFRVTEFDDPSWPLWLIEPR